MPRRAQISATGTDVYRDLPIAVPHLLTAISGVMLLVSGLMFFYVLLRMLLSPRIDQGEVTPPLPYREVLSHAGEHLAQANRLVRVTEPVLALWVAALLLGMVTNLQSVPGWKLY